jgi:LysM repeat protein
VTPPLKAQTHTVARNETMAAIARKAGVSLEALQAANPGVNPRHLQTGQLINLPPP